MKKKPKGPKNWASHKNNWYDDAQPSEERKNKEKEPKLNIGGHDRLFWKDNSKDKRSGNKHKWFLVLKFFKHLLSLQISFFFVTNSPSLHYTPNQALSNQRQAIWIGRKCFLMRTKSLFMQIKWMLWIPVLCNHQIKSWTILTNQTSLHIFAKSKTKKSFHHFWKPLHRNHLNFFRMSLLWIDVKMISVSGIALKFKKFCMKTTPCQTFLYIASSLNSIWILEGMIKIGGNQKMHGRAGSMIPFLKKYWAKLETLEIKGGGPRSMMISSPS